MSILSFSSYALWFYYSCNENSCIFLPHLVFQNQIQEGLFTMLKKNSDGMHFYN